MKDTFLVYKPFGMLSQFSKEIAAHITLKDLAFKFRPNIYPIGRLDKDSEGLLLLSNDKSLNDKILNPKNKLEKTYWAQVEGNPSHAQINQLVKGVSIKVKKKNHHVKAIEVKLMDSPSMLPARNPPIRFRKNVDDRWLSITISEGKNRQIRKMCAQIGFPVLRLIRSRIGKIVIGQYPFIDPIPGQVVKIEPRLIF